MIRRLLLTLFVAAGLVGCATQQAPVTGRDQFILISEEQAARIGAQAFQQYRQERPVRQSGAFADKVERIGRDIVADNGGNPDEGEFFAVDDDAPNAFALPGKYIGMHTGMQKAARTDDQLAAVLAHEIAHLRARHSAERMSRQMARQLGLTAVGALTDSQQLTQVASLATDVALTLPFTRTQESEADAISLEYMARAGYDPRAAIELWQNMQEVGGPSPPEFLSTHPSGESRIAELRNRLPAAMQIYEGVPHE